MALELIRSIIGNAVLNRTPAKVAPIGLVVTLTAYGVAATLFVAAAAYASRRLAADPSTTDDATTDRQ